MKTIFESEDYKTWLEVGQYEPHTKTKVLKFMSQMKNEEPRKVWEGHLDYASAQNMVLFLQKEYIYNTEIVNGPNS